MLSLTRAHSMDPHLIGGHGEVSLIKPAKVAIA